MTRHLCRRFRFFCDGREQQSHGREEVEVAAVLRVVHRDLLVVADDLAEALHGDDLSRRQPLAVVVDQRHRNRNFEVAVGVVQRVLERTGSSC